MRGIVAADLGREQEAMEVVYLAHVLYYMIYISFWQMVVGDCSNGLGFCLLWVQGQDSEARGNPPEFDKVTASPGPISSYVADTLSCLALIPSRIRGSVDAGLWWIGSGWGHLALG